MNKYEIKAMQESADFLFKNKMPRYFLWDVLNSSFKAKRNLIQLLNLKEEDGYRIDIPIPSDAEDGFTKFVDYLCLALKKRDSLPWTRIDKTFIQDSKKNKYKVTKVLTSELFGDMLRIASKISETDWNVLVKLAEDGGKCNSLCSDDCVKKFAIWWGDQAKAGKRKLILSAHPVDILTASQNSSFTSCYSPGGGYFNGVITSMLSPDTLIATVEDLNRPGYKVGRSWIYVNTDMIICARQYGGITNNHHLHIRNFIQAKLGGDWILKNNSWTINDGLVDMQGPGYLDRGHGNVALRSDLNHENPEDIYKKIKKIIMPKAICLFCGAEYGKTCNIKGVCKRCAEGVSQKDLEA